jgi:hypothetical protein
MINKIFGGSRRETATTELRKQVENARNELTVKKKQLGELVQESTHIDENIERTSQRLLHIDEELQQRRSMLTEIMNKKQTSTLEKNDVESKEEQHIIREKLIELTKNIKRVEEIDPELREVNVKYLKGVRSGDIAKLHRGEDLEVTFNVNRTTTFNELKIAACNFWNISNPHLMELHLSNFSLTHLLSNQVVTTIKEQKSSNTLLFFEFNEYASKLFDEQKDFFFA